VPVYSTPMTSVLIVESPAKCAKIQGFLGPGWKVIATMGHIRALDDTLDAVGLDRDFEPKYQFLKEKAKAITQIKDVTKGAKVYLASDDDREGEAISYSVAVLLNLDPATTPRAVFREITKDAVQNAVKNPRLLDMNRVWAQQARAVLDMMVGFTISPLLWKYVGSGLSAGRCQTPALRILTDKEESIRNFSSTTTWKVRGHWTTGSISFEAMMTEELEDRESAENYLDNLREETLGTVKESTTIPTTESPPKPLITSTLQQEASASLGIQPANTMKIAQRLYEAGHITYMRTDSEVLCEEAKTAARAWVVEAFGQDYLAVATPPKKKTGAQATRTASTTPPPQEAHESRKKTSSTNPPPQEAHEAIRPTHFDTRVLPEDEDWSAADRKIYTLIWNRATQSVMAAAKGEKHTIQFVANADPVEFVWAALWKRELFAGWKKIGAAATNLDEDEQEAAAAGEAAWAAATDLQAGDSIHWSSLEAAPYDARPPARLTEATLVRELERKGIGRPSTFASLVATLHTKNYVEKRDTPARDVEVLRLSMEPGQPLVESKEKKKMGGEKNKLVPTALGASALEFCVKEFEQLFAYEFTKTMETRLDSIASGSEPWKNLCRDIWGSYNSKYTALKEGKSTVAAAPSRERLFAGGIKAVQSKKGPLLLKEGPQKGEAVFYGWPEGKSFQAITEQDVAAFVAMKQSGGATLGTFEGQTMVKKSGPFGIYVQCGTTNVPWTPEDTEETLQQKFVAKKQVVSHKIGPFEIRTGQYGMYMFKPELTGKSRKFVSIPAGIDPKSLTQEAVVKMYQADIQGKARGKAFQKKREPTVG
jgi:DNA topoisomerase-1